MTNFRLFVFEKSHFSVEKCKTHNNIISTRIQYEKKKEKNEDEIRVTAGSLLRSKIRAIMDHYRISFSKRSKTYKN